MKHKLSKDIDKNNVKMVPDHFRTISDDSCVDCMYNMSTFYRDLRCERHDIEEKEIARHRVCNDYVNRSKKVKNEARISNM